MIHAPLSSCCAHCDIALRAQRMNNEAQLEVGAGSWELGAQATSLVKLINGAITIKIPVANKAHNFRLDFAEIRNRSPNPNRSSTAASTDSTCS